MFLFYGDVTATRPLGMLAVSIALIAIALAGRVVMGRSTPRSLV